MGLRSLLSTRLSIWYVTVRIKPADCSVWIWVPHGTPAEALAMLRRWVEGKCLSGVVD